MSLFLTEIFYEIQKGEWFKQIKFMSYQSCPVVQCFPIFCHALSRNRSINLLNKSVDWFLRPRLLENIEIKEGCDTE